MRSGKGDHTFLTSMVAPLEHSNPDTRQQCLTYGRYFTCVLRIHAHAAHDRGLEGSLTG